MIESARISRSIQDLSSLRIGDFSGIVFPGGYGVMKNLSNLAFAEQEPQILPDMVRIVEEFYTVGKPIGGICIAPALLTKILGRQTKLTVTLGKDEEGTIAKLGGIHKDCIANDIVVDSKNKVVTTPAFMTSTRLVDIAEGIDKLVQWVIDNA
jgi:enhancing lycopene biosynthesis protein 2